MLALLLGAGFSRVAGVPLAGQLFDEEPVVDRITRQRLVNRVLAGWRQYSSGKQVWPEEYLASLEASRSREWFEAQWYVGLLIALKMGRVEMVGTRPTITRHNIDRTSSVPVHEQFWSAVFQRTSEIGVITTNYDILPERGLRHEPRPRVPRPGFHYGQGPEALAGGGYPSYAHIQKVSVRGSVPLLKLHGSLNWSVREGRVVRYHDCRPAIRGDAMIVAPVAGKMMHPELEPVWTAARQVLRQSPVWIIVGYSLPEYELALRDLLASNGEHQPTVHVLDPNERVGDKYRRLLPNSSVTLHAGLPDGLDSLAEVMKGL